MISFYAVGSLTFDPEHLSILTISFFLLYLNTKKIERNKTEFIMHGYNVLVFFF